MNIQVVTVGKLKEKYWKDAIKEYSKRMGRYCKLNIIECKEERTIKLEGENILKAIKRDTYIITLEIKGKQLSSEDLAVKINELGLIGKSDITFIIGGSLGLDSEILNVSDFSLSFSKMTFPHQMMRVILLEQVYRAFKINSNETYHK